MDGLCLDSMQSIDSVIRLIMLLFSHGKIGMGLYFGWLISRGWIGWVRTFKCFLNDYIQCAVVFYANNFFFFSWEKLVLGGWYQEDEWVSYRSSNVCFEVTADTLARKTSTFSLVVQCFYIFRVLLLLFWFLPRVYFELVLFLFIFPICTWYPSIYSGIVLVPLHMVYV